MDVEAFKGVRRGPIGSRIVTVAITSVVMVATVLWLGMALAPPHPPGSVLTGTTWRWTGGTSGAADTPLVVPGSSTYTIEFMPDWTFLATTDCTAVAGTYRVIPAGRTGLSTTGIRLRPDAPGPSPAACGSDSPAGAFLQGLWSAARYEIADSILTLLLHAGGTMTFEAEAPAT